MEDLVKAIKAVLEDGEVKLHPKRFDYYAIIFVIGIFLDNCGGVNKFLLISTEMAKRICGC
jgi:hypothetical protein